MKQIVIEIFEEQYNTIKSDLYNTFPAEMKKWGLEAIRNGTPLPKGHGDMVDRDAVNSRFYSIRKELESYSNQPSYKELLDKLSMCLDTAQPIIEADELENEE